MEEDEEMGFVDINVVLPMYACMMLSPYPCLMLWWVMIVCMPYPLVQFPGQVFNWGLPEGGHVM